MSTPCWWGGSSEGLATSSRNISIYIYIDICLYIYVYIYIYKSISISIYNWGNWHIFLCVWMIIFKITTSIDTSNLSSLWDLGESSDQFAGVFALGGIQNFMISVEHFNLWRKEWWFIHQCCIKTDAFWLIVSSLIHFFAKLWCLSFLSDIGAHVWDPKNAQNEISGAILFNHIDGQIYMCKGHNLDQGQFDVCFGSCLYVFVTLNFMLFLFLKCYLMGVVFGQMQKLVAAWLCGCLYIKIHNNITSFFTYIFFLHINIFAWACCFPNGPLKICGFNYMFVITASRWARSIGMSSWRGLTDSLAYSTPPIPTWEENQSSFTSIC